MKLNDIWVLLSTSKDDRAYVLRESRMCEALMDEEMSGADDGIIDSDRWSSRIKGYVTLSETINGGYIRLDHLQERLKFLCGWFPEEGSYIEDVEVVTLVKANAVNPELLQGVFDRESARVDGLCSNQSTTTGPGRSSPSARRPWEL